jgi:hypothetical protein
MVLTDALLEQPGLRSSLVVSGPLITILGTKLTWVQNSGFSVTSSCKTLTLLGMLVTAASALLTLLEKLEHTFLSIHVEMLLSAPYGLRAAHGVTELMILTYNNCSVIWIRRANQAS